VDFPLTQLDPAAYLAAVPATTLRRHRELLAAGLPSRPVRPSLLATLASVPPIAEAGEPVGLVTRQPSTGSGLDVAEVHVCIEDGEDPNDSGIESNGCNGGHPSLERGRGPLLRGASTGSDVFEQEPGEVQSTTFRQGMRQRQISTSLVSHPVVDDNLLDFHGHKLEESVDPLSVQYNMYSMVCHSGVLGGGHYVSYSKTESNKWFCHNDSSCKEVPVGSIDKSSAYILMYERAGLSMEQYMPDTAGLTRDTGDLDEEFDLDFKKQCSLM
jgi:ubiquitin carboxyl-terminal hydrolase 6/32